MIANGHSMMWAAVTDHLKGCVVYIDDVEKERLTKLRKRFFFCYLGSCGLTRFHMDWRDYFLSGGFVEGKRLPFVDVHYGLSTGLAVKVLDRSLGELVESELPSSRNGFQPAVVWSAEDKENFDDEHG